MEMKCVCVHLLSSEPPSRRGSIVDEGHHLLPSSARGSLVEFRELDRCTKARERVQSLCSHGAKMLGATLTGALAGGALGCATFNPVGVGIGAGTGGLAALLAHWANDPEGDPDSLRNQVSQGARNALGGALGVAETGVLSAGFGARFATIAELESVAREMGLGETETTIMVGFAAAAVTVGWALAIGGLVGAGAIAARAGKELINAPGAKAGSPLRIPADPLKDLAVCILCAFATANVQAIRDAAAVAAGHGPAQLGPFAFGDSLAPPEFELSSGMTSALVASTAAMVALCLYMKEGGAWKDMPVSNRQELGKFAVAQLREKMHGALNMAACSPLTSIFKMELPDHWSLKLLGETLKLGTSPAAMFGYYAAYMEHLSQHPAEEGASSAATPAFFAGGLLFSISWIGLLMKWGLGKSPEALDAVDATPRTPYTDLQHAAIMCLGVLTIALAADRGLDEVSPDRGPGEKAAFALALMMGFFAPLAARLGSPQHTLRQAKEGYVAAFAGFTTGALNAGLPAALAVTGATLFEQAAALLYDWCLKQQDMAQVTQAAVQAQAEKRAADEAPTRAAAALQEAAINARIEEEVTRRMAQALAQRMEPIEISPLHSQLSSLSVVTFDTPRKRVTSPRALMPDPDDSE